MPEPLVYLVYGRERGESGTPHLQGYVSFSTKKTLPYVRRLISERAHFETTRGTPKEASDYCKKDGDWAEFGSLPRGSGSRTDLRAVAEAVQAGASLREIAERDPSAFIRYSTGILRLQSHVRPQRRTDRPEIWTFWGKTGVGKTRRVYQFVQPAELWVSSGTTWFDGYDGHRAVLFDDFDGGWFKLSYLLKLLDRYVFQVPVKGGFTWWYPDHIYITTNIHPTDWYPNGSLNHKEALLRRLTEFGHIEECT